MTEQRSSIGLGVELVGAVVRLEPLLPEHTPSLVEAAADDGGTFGFTLVPRTPEEMEAYVSSALVEQADGTTLPFAIRRVADHRVIGSTRFLDLQYWAGPNPWVPSDGERALPSAGEIGATWLSASAQRSGANLEAKQLLLTHAFEVWGMQRITLKTDARNRRSRAAIERLGATFEGVRRAHLPATDGTLRDSAYYSIVAEEWPVVRRSLAQRRRER